MSEPMNNTAPSMYEHYCEYAGCVEWGGWGFENRRTKRTEWFCYEHRLKDYAGAGREMARTTAEADSCVTP